MKAFSTLLSVGGVALVLGACANGNDAEIATPGGDDTAADASRIDGAILVNDSGDTILGDAAIDATTANQDAAIDGGADAAVIDGASTSVEGGVDASNTAGSCDSPNTCGTSMMIGNSISGDTGSDHQVVNGITAEWVSIRVTENDQSAIGRMLQLRATLNAPANAIFSLHVYLDPTLDTIDCSSVYGESDSMGPNNSVSVSWGEGSVANGSDDSRTVEIEIREESGTCAPGEQWTLTLAGNGS